MNFLTKLKVEAAGTTGLAGKKIFIAGLPAECSYLERELKKAGAEVVYPILPVNESGLTGEDVARMLPEIKVQNAVMVVANLPRLLRKKEHAFDEEPAIQLADALKLFGIPTLAIDLPDAADFDRTQKQKMQTAGLCYTHALSQDALKPGEFIERILAGKVAGV